MNINKTLIITLLICPITSYGFSASIDQKLGHIVNAINSVLQKRYSPEEQRWINSLGILRRDLSTDYTKIGNYTISHMAQIISIPAYPWGTLLLKLAHELQPNSMLDIGTCIGFSSAYFAAGLDINKKGKLITLETFLPIVPLANANFEFLGLTHHIELIAGPINKTLPAALNKLSPIDIVFDDHIHEEGPVLRYFEEIYPHLQTSSVYIWDDIARNPGMEKAWNALKNDPRINITIEIMMGIPYHDFSIEKPRVGICILDKNSTDKQHYAIDFSRTGSVKLQNGIITQITRRS